MRLRKRAGDQPCITEYDMAASAFGVVTEHSLADPFDVDMRRFVSIGVSNGWKLFRSNLSLLTWTLPQIMLRACKDGISTEP